LLEHQKEVLERENASVEVIVEDEKTKQDRLMKANAKESVEQLKLLFVKINK
jgi:hypothetical protein